MAVATSTGKRPRRPLLLLSGFAAIAESLWMGAPQAADVLEVLHLARLRGRAPGRLPVLRIPRLRLAGLLTRELTIAEASFVLMASFLLSAFLGAVRQVLFNVEFGVGSEASAFYAAIRLPDALFSLVAGGALSSAMIPVLLATAGEEGERAAARLVNLVLNALLAAFVLLVLVGELLTPAFVTHLLAPGFDASTSATTVSLTRLMLLQPVVLAVGSVATAVLNSRNRFGLTALSIASHNLGLIAGIVATRVDPQLGIYGPTFGVLAGALLQVLVLLPGLLSGGFRYQPVIDLRDARLRQVTALLVPNGLAVGVAYTGFIVDTAFASQAPQPGALPAVHNAFMLVGLPIALLGQAVGQSAFPRLAAHATAERWGEMVRTLARSLAAVVALAVPALLGLLLLGRLAIRILFEHGRFGESAGSLTYQVLAVYSIALPAYVAAELLVRGLIALRDTRTPLLTNTVQITGRALIMALLIHSLGVLAIPVAFAVMATLEAFALAAVLGLRMRRRLQPVPV